MSDWIENLGGRMPFDPETLVQVRFRNHESIIDDFYSDTGKCMNWDWYIDGGDDDIISYRKITNVRIRFKQKQHRSSTPKDRK